MAEADYPWEGLGPGDARRMNSSGSRDFFWLVLDDGAPGMMLKLGAVPDPLPSLPKLKNLEVGFRRAGEGWAFVLGLKERSQTDLFETLCRDVEEAGEEGKTPEDALARAIQRTRRWHQLLKGGRPGGLTLEEQRGLVGELAFLRELATGFAPDAAAEAWTGPEGSVKDFEMIGCCVEIKTRGAASRPAVIISSEHQLADVAGARSFLRVFDVASAVVPNGMSLHDHVAATRDALGDDEAAIETWETRLQATGYDPDDDYENRRWEIGGASTFEIVEGFPRLTAPLPMGLSTLRYRLDLAACAEFRHDEDLVETIRRGLEE